MGNTKKLQLAGTLLYDGECKFCQLCAFILKKRLAHRIEITPYQENLDRFPFLAENQCAGAVQWVGVDGVVRTGAYAIYTCLTFWGDRWISAMARLFCRGYERSGVFRKCSDGLYWVVTNHRNWMWYGFNLLLGSAPFMIGYRNKKRMFFYRIRCLIGIAVMCLYAMGLLWLALLLASKDMRWEDKIAEIILMVIGLLCGLEMVISPTRFFRFFFIALITTFCVVLKFWK